MKFCDLPRDRIVISVRKRFQSINRHRQKEKKKSKSHRMRTRTRNKNEALQQIYIEIYIRLLKLQSGHTCIRMCTSILDYTPLYHILNHRNMRNLCYGIVFAQNIKSISYNEQFTVSPHVEMMFRTKQKKKKNKHITY